MRTVTSEVGCALRCGDGENTPESERLLEIIDSASSTCMAHNLAYSPPRCSSSWCRPRSTTIPAGAREIRTGREGRRVTCFEHDDLVGVHDGGEPMGDNQRRAAV